jgi:hypothetical protein
MLYPLSYMPLLKCLALELPLRCYLANVFSIARHLPLRLLCQERNRIDWFAIAAHLEVKVRSCG